MCRKFEQFISYTSNYDEYNFILTLNYGKAEIQSRSKKADVLFMNHFVDGRNSLEWSDATIKNQVALDGPMEAVNRRYARFAGSKFKARRATGLCTIIGPQ